MPRALPPLTERAGELGLLAFFALALCLLFPYFEATRNANERPRLMQAMAIVDAGELAIDGPAGRGLDPGPDVARSDVDGRVYPNKPPGASVVAAGAYVVARAVSDPKTDPLTLRRLTLWARLLTAALPTLLLAWFLVRRLTAVRGRAAAMGAVVLYVLGTPAQAYAHVAYAHQLAALLLIVGIWGIVRGVVDDDGSRRSTVYVTLGGLFAGAAVVVEYGAVFAGLPIAALLLWRANRPRPLALAAAAAAGAVLSVTMLALYHDAAFGSPWQTGYHHVTNPEFVRKHGQGLLGLGWPTWDGFHTNILAADTGLLWWSPLAVLGWYGLARVAVHGEPRVRAEARVYLGLWVIYLLVASGLGFEGGWRVGPRYLVLILPTLALGWADVLGQVSTEPRWLLAILAFGVYAIIVNTLAANWWPHIDPTNVHQPVGELLLPLWSDAKAPYGIDEAAWGSVVAKTIVVGIVVCALLVLARCVELRPANIIVFVVGTLIGVALVVMTTLWPEHPRGRANLAYVERVWEPESKTPPNSIVLPPVDPSRAQSQ